MTGGSAAFDFTPFLGRIGLFFVDGAPASNTSGTTAPMRRAAAATMASSSGTTSTTREVTQFVMDLRRSGAEVFGLRGTRLAFSRHIGRLRGILA